MENLEINRNPDKISDPVLNNFEQDWDRFNEWIHCMCVITFDLELGQAMEVIYPNHVQLSEQEKMNICYLAFPDSNSGCMGDTQFHIRLRVAPGTPDTLLSYAHRMFNSQCLPVQRADNGHYYGFVYFRQTKDVSIPRGYFQKSFIILTRLPFFNLFYEVCSLIAPRYFEDSNISKLACQQICTWPSLRAGTSITLHLLGTVYQSYIPRVNSSHFKNNNSNSNNNNSKNKERQQHNCKDNDCNCPCKGDSSNEDEIEDSPTTCPCSSSSSSTLTSNVCCEKRGYIVRRELGPMLPPQVLGTVHEVDIFRSLSNFIFHIHLLWELVLIGEPIVVMAQSPADCSHMVQSLTSMISPLAYCAESRPYFTIHDSEFKEFTQRNQGPPSIIIGVTNPFFIKPLQNWPHLIRLGDNHYHQDYHQQQQQQQQYKSLLNQNEISPININNRTITTTTQSSLVNFKKAKTFNSSKSFLDNTSGVYTKYKTFLQKDNNVIKKIMHGIKTKRPHSVQNVLLRRYLLELTQSFMIPLERYIASLMPLQKDISPFKAAPNPDQFKQDDFLATLEQSGPQLTSNLKGDWVGLYKRFFRSPNFLGWYENRDMELRQTLQALQLKALSDADLNKWAQGKHEVEIVDMILKLKQKLKICSSESHLNQDGNNEIGGSCNSLLKKSTRDQLLKHVENMKQSLPEDLKILLKDT